MATRVRFTTTRDNQMVYMKTIVAAQFKTLSAAIKAGITGELYVFEVDATKHSLDLLCRWADLYTNNANEVSSLRPPWECDLFAPVRNPPGESDFLYSLNFFDVSDLLDAVVALGNDSLMAKLALLCHERNLRSDCALPFSFASKNAHERKRKVDDDDTDMGYGINKK